MVKSHFGNNFRLSEKEGLSHVTQQAKFGIKTTQHVIPKDKAEISSLKRALSTSCVYLGLLIILRLP